MTQHGLAPSKGAAERRIPAVACAETQRDGAVLLHVSVAHDVLVITVPLREIVEERERTADGVVIVERPARYPSAKSQSANAATYGRKTIDVRVLALDVEAAAEAALAAGWQPIDKVGGARATVTRYVPDGRVFDAWSLGQVEADALTRTGVWNDDSLPTPVSLDVQPNDHGTDRVVVIVQRLTTAEDARTRKPRPRIKRRVRGVHSAVAERSEIPGPVSTPEARRAGVVRSIEQIGQGERVSFQERDSILAREPRPQNSVASVTIRRPL